MARAFVPPNEADRLAALRALEIVDTPASELFDSFVRVARSLFDVPIAAISLVEEDRQWFKAVEGWCERQTPRSMSFCSHAILDPHNVLYVPDARWDPRFADNALVTGPAGVRFYAGATVVGPGNYALGSLCIIDHRPRQMTPDQLARLSDLARGVSAALQLHGAAKQLDREVRSDPLTGLGNRREFDLVMHRLGATGVSVLLLDLDGFKAINDLFGHAGGDAALREVARRLEAAIPDDCLSFRLGGDEFAILAPGTTDAAERLALAGRLHASLADTFVLDGTVVPMRTSIGIATVPDDASTPKDALRMADIALYQAKAAGRGTTRTAAECAGMASSRGQATDRRSVPSGAIGRIDLGNRLRQALVPAGYEPFTLVFQPIVDLQTGRATTLEALIRWDVDQGVSLPPGEFVTAAERLGLVSHLDRWVLNTACRTAAAWDGGWRVSVNISAASFALIDVAAMVESALAVTGLPASRLVIEMTETALAGDATRVRQAVEALRMLGVGVALDDFGAGHGSLTTLRQFPFSAIKIDKGLIDGIEADRAQMHLLDLVGKLGQSLGVDVVMEGVETEEVLRAVTRLGARFAQGRLLSWPVANAGVERAVAQAERVATTALALDGEAV